MRIIALSIIASLTGALHAQNGLPADAIATPDPADQMASFVLDENLEINLFASDPMIAKPVAMNWDAQGRLWVVSSRLYPHIKPNERSNDQVVVLERILEHVEEGDGLDRVLPHHELVAVGLEEGEAPVLADRGRPDGGRGFSADHREE